MVSPGYTLGPAQSPEAHRYINLFIIWSHGRIRDYQKDGRLLRSIETVLAKSHMGLRELELTAKLHLVPFQTKTGTFPLFEITCRYRYPFKPDRISWFKGALTLSFVGGK